MNDLYSTYILPKIHRHMFKYIQNVLAEGNFSPIPGDLVILYKLKRGVLGFSVLDSGSRGPGSSPGRPIALCPWARQFTVIVSLSTQEYKWVPANCHGNLTKCWEVTCDGLASHPGGLAILLVLSCYGNWDKLRQ